MAGSINKVILLGNLGADPEVRHSNDGNKIVSFSLATTDTWRNKSGERQDKTEWHRIVVFSQGLCEVAEKYLKKGSKVYIEGQIQIRKWQDNSGQEKYTTEIVLSNFSSNLIMCDRNSSMGDSSIPDNEIADSATPIDSSSLDIDDELPPF